MGSKTPFCVDPDRHLPVEVSLDQCLQFLRDRLVHRPSLWAGGNRGQVLSHCRVCHLLIPGRNLFVLNHFCCSDMGESRILAGNNLLLRIICRGVCLFFENQLQESCVARMIVNERWIYLSSMPGLHTSCSLHHRLQ